MFMHVFLDDFASGLDGDFSYEACILLYDYFNELEDSTNEMIEFAPIAIRCEFAEYDSWKECLEDYSNLIDEDEEINTVEKAEEFLVEHTQVLACNDDICLIEQF